MIQNRCVADLLSYCSGKPRVTTEKRMVAHTPDHSFHPDNPDGLWEETFTTCELNPKSCGKFKTASQVIPIKKKAHK